MARVVLNSAGFGLGKCPEPGGIRTEPVIGNGCANQKALTGLRLRTGPTTPSNLIQVYVEISVGFLRNGFVDATGNHHAGDSTLDHRRLYPTVRENRESPENGESGYEGCP
jgi:hypothetical protein